MATTANLRLVVSQELDTDGRDLEHDTLVVTPEFARRVMEAFESEPEGATIIDFPVHARS